VGQAENQTQVFRLPPNPWESQRDSHIPTAAAASLFFTFSKTKTGKRTVGRGKVEIEKHDSHFSTAPIACGARKESVWCAPGRTPNTPRKETPAADYFFPSPGSFFGENMLRGPLGA